MKTHNCELKNICCDDFSLFGYSFAGEETIIIAPELNCSFDIGRCPQEALPLDYVLLSHGHIDHAAGLPYYFAQRYFCTHKSGTALVPMQLVEPLEELMQCWQKIDGNIPPYKIIGMHDNENFALNLRLKAYAFTTNHLGPSLGYAIIEVRQKLKKEFCSLPKEKIIELKKNHIEITENEEIPLLAYLGDTALGDFMNLPYVNNAKVLITECTFFKEDQKDKGHAFKHLHVSDLAMLLKNSNNRQIIISHVSKSIKTNEAKKILQEHLDQVMLQKIEFLMN